MLRKWFGNFWMKCRRDMTNINLELYLPDIDKTERSQ
jgi:lauroyl/myristoyl acyltransferase